MDEKDESELYDKIRSAIYDYGFASEDGEECVVNNLSSLMDDLLNIVREYDGAVRQRIALDLEKRLRGKFKEMWRTIQDIDPLEEDSLPE